MLSDKIRTKLQDIVRRIRLKEREIVALSQPFIEEEQANSFRASLLEIIS
jgi:hypothetical protein